MALNFDNLPVTVRLKKFLLEMYNTLSLGGTGQTLTNSTIVGGTSTAKAVATSYTAGGVVPLTEGVVDIAGTSAITMTIAAPSTAQDGTIITFLGSTAFAHIVTFTGATLVNGTASAHTTATFPAYVGGTLRVIARTGKWYVSGNSSVTLT